MRLLFVLAMLATLTMPAGAASRTYAQTGAQAIDAMLTHWYVLGGKWLLCQQGCPTNHGDWGADSMTYVMYARYVSTGDSRLPAHFRGVEQALAGYGAPCKRGVTACTWSDIPMWDSIAASRAYAVTHDGIALKKAGWAFDVIDGSTDYAFGACPRLNYQRPNGSTGLKTLETDSNYVKAAILLYEETKNGAYLTKAVAKYAAIRQSFFDAAYSLYTVYVFDNGSQCVQVPRRFYASVNGNMIWNGLYLSKLTGTQSYLNDALATARAAASTLSDANGIYADLQAGNDVLEPLAEAMHDVSRAGYVFAGDWVLNNAAAQAMQPDGSYGRFFDGPVQPGQTDVFETNGGFALAIEAADLSPTGSEPQPISWSGASYTTRALASGEAVTFTGSGIAIAGTIGEQCCEPGHARVFIDGLETVDGTGIWQNKSSSHKSMPNSILFAWRWPTSGTHTIGFAPGVYNAKEGGSYLHAAGYYTLP